MRRVSTVIFLLIQFGYIFSVLGAQPINPNRAPGGNARPLESRIDSLVDPYLNASSFSGDILVARDGKLLFNKGYGLANRERSTRVTPQTRFYIASITKSFTAAAVLLLQERNKLKLSDPVSRFISNFPNGERITIHHLLTHTSGIADSLRFPDFSELSRRPYTTEEAVRLFRNKPLMFEPGERSSYSNSNYVLLALIIEKVSGLKYADFLKINFFIPLRMNDTGQQNSSETENTQIASGLTPVGLHEFETPRYFDRSILAGACSLYSTTEDLNKWIEGLRTGRVLEKNFVDQMFKGPSDGSSGYAWKRGKLWNRDMIIEDGWDGVGFAGTLIHFPNEDVTVVVLGNLNISSVTSSIAEAVSALVFDEAFESFKINPAPISREFARKLVGKYKLGDDFYVPGTVLEIVEKDGNLYEQQRNPNRLMGLIPVSALEFIHRSSWGKMKFETDDGGEIKGMLFYDRFKALKLSDQ